MRAIEFKASIDKSMIRVPSKYNVTDKTPVKVILLYEQEIESDRKSNYDKQSLLLCFEKAKQKDVFRTIEDTAAWQKKVRDDWE